MNTHRMIQAAAPQPTRDLALTCPVSFEAAAKDAAGTPRLATFKMTAYNGGKMSVGMWDYPVVVDLKGMKIPSQSIPMRMQHDAGEGVGHTTKIDLSAGTVYAEGVISRATQAAEDVAASARNGFPWQASIGARVNEYEFVKAGQSAVVNGQTVEGPCYVMRASELGEISFVDLGADTGTTVQVAAKAQTQNPKSNNTGDPDMKKFAEWLQAMGLEESTLTPEAKTKLQAKYDAEKATLESAADTPPVQAAAPTIDPAVQAMRIAAAAESARIAGIQKVTASNPEIQTKALSEGWNVERAELETLRAARPSAPTPNGFQNPTVTTDVLAAAVSLALEGSATAEKSHKAPALEAAAKRFRAQIGLKELILEAARANGFTGTSHELNGMLRAAFAPPVMASGFTTVSIAGILSNIANKFLLAGFTSTEQTWRMIAAIRAVNDFKTVTSYRLTGDDVYAKVSPAGEIEHGTLTDENFTNKADSYGKLLVLTRQDIINDDLGALNSLPRKLGRGAGLKFNKVFWTAFMDNASFFTSGSYISGATTTPSTAGLKAALKAFRALSDADGNIIGVEPRVMLVPSDLEVDALALNQALLINTGGASTTDAVPNANVFYGKYKVAPSAYLSNTNYTGASALAWYLLADPQDIAAIEACFLNGQQSPTIETATADFDTLGIQLRGYFDFGVSLQDKRAGVKSKGAA